MAMRDVSQHSLTMLFCIAIIGGLTLMMGQHARSESLFYSSCIGSGSRGIALVRGEGV